MNCPSWRPWRRCRGVGGSSTGWPIDWVEGERYAILNGIILIIHDHYGDF